MQKGDFTGLGLVLAGILVVAAFFVFAPEAPEMSFGPVDVGGGSLSVPEQTNTTDVTLSATLVKSGFVTIHESIGAAPGPIIGVSAFLNEGTHDDLVIAVSDMTPGLTYIALLHVDNGDGRYVTNDDMPVMTDGVVVRADVKAAGESIFLPSE